MTTEKKQNLKKLTYICLSLSSLMISSDGQAGGCFSKGDQEDHAVNGGSVSIPRTRKDITAEGENLLGPKSKKFKTSNDQTSSDLKSPPMGMVKKKGLLEFSKEFEEKSRMLNKKLQKEDQKATEDLELVIKSFVPKKAQPLTRRIVSSVTDKSPKHLKNRKLSTRKEYSQRR